MSVTRQQKILLGLVGIGACALLVDRLVAGSENAAQAIESSPPPVQPAAAGQTHAIHTLSSSVSPSLSERIRKGAEQTPQGAAARDIFRVPPAWSGAETSPTTVAAGSANLPRFEQTHRLNALILAGSHSGALIDSTLVKLGQSIDGYRLVRVAPGMAQLESSGGRAILRIEDRVRGA